MSVDDVGPEILVIIGCRELVPSVQLRIEEGGQSCFQLLPDVGVVDVGGLVKDGPYLAGVLLARSSGSVGSPLVGSTSFTTSR